MVSPSAHVNRANEGMLEELLAAFNFYPEMLRKVVKHKLIRHARSFMRSLAASRRTHGAPTTLAVVRIGGRLAVPVGDSRVYLVDARWLAPSAPKDHLALQGMIDRGEATLDTEYGHLTRWNMWWADEEEHHAPFIALWPDQPRRHNCALHRQVQDTLGESDVAPVRS
jgi:hypothetical protein